jgi:uncharacterized protein DUF1353
MAGVSRREFLKLTSGISAVNARVFQIGSVLFGGQICISAQANTRKHDTKRQWLEDVFLSLQTRRIDSPLYMGRFKDRMYFLLKSISWSPNPAQIGRLSDVTVPQGFVTDLASIPAAFSSLLPTDGEYAYAAIVHDFLYWAQTRPKAEADEILKIGMQDLGVETWKINSIFAGVRSPFGLRAWNDNAASKARGDKRVLKEYPPTAAIAWADWKQRPNVFVP